MNKKAHHRERLSYRQSSLSAAKTLAKGFTMLELMVTVGIASILLAVAIPSFTSVIARNTASTEAVELIAALNLARSEAIKRNNPVSVSAVNGNWGQGYFIATTAAPIEQIKQVLLDSQANPPVEQSTPPLTSIVYAGSGGLSTADTPQFRICKPSTSEGRQINISPTGRVSSSVIRDCL